MESLGLGYGKPDIIYASYSYYGETGSYKNKPVSSLTAQAKGVAMDMREPYKEVFTLRVFGELPFEKIAVLFGKTPNWARVTFYRAKKEIIEYMEGIENGKNQL